MATLVCMSAEVVVAFLGSQSPMLKKHYLNDLASALGPAQADSDPDKMVHTELYFPHTQHALSIVHNGKVSLHPKNFSKTGWTYKSVPVSEHQLEKIERFARSAVGDGFNTAGYFMPCGLGTSQLGATLSDPCNAAGATRTWYCSELVSHALASAGSQQLLDDLGVTNVECLHPHSLWQAISKSDISYSTAPEFKLELLQYD